MLDAVRRSAAAAAPDYFRFAISRLIASILRS
jgi:hypothetical protein